MYLSFSLASYKKSNVQIVEKIVCKFAMISYHYYLKKPMKNIAIILQIICWTIASPHQ